MDFERYIKKAEPTVSMLRGARANAHFICLPCHFFPNFEST